MIYLKRKVDAFLEEWSNNSDKKPLIIKRSRQVGKTESIRRFAKQHYENVIEINFVEEPKYKMITSDGYKTDYEMYSLDFEEFCGQRDMGIPLCMICWSI